MKTASLLAALRALFQARTKETRENFRRTLPFGELIVDRWEKARLLNFEEGVSIYDSAIVFGDVHVGARTWIGPQVILDGSAAPLRVGAWCSISAGVQIYTHDSVARAVTGGKASLASAPVTIGDNVYIGPLCAISKGVCIGEGSIIGAHSLVNADIPPGSAAWGCPARVTGSVIPADDGLSYHIEPRTDDKYK